MNVGIYYCNVNDQQIFRKSHFFGHQIVVWKFYLIFRLLSKFLILFLELRIECPFFILFISNIWIIYIYIYIKLLFVNNQLSFRNFVLLSFSLRYLHLDTSRVWWINFEIWTSIILYILDGSSWRLLICHDIICTQCTASGTIFIK